MGRILMYSKSPPCRSLDDYLLDLREELGEPVHVIKVYGKDKAMLKRPSGMSLNYFLAMVLKLGADDAWSVEKHDAVCVSVELGGNSDLCLWEND